MLIKAKKKLAKILTNGVGLKDYVPVGLQTVTTEILLDAGPEMTIIVSGRQFCVAYNPLVLAIALTDAETEACLSKKVTLQICTQGRRAVMHASFWRKGIENLSLFHISDASLLQIDVVRRNLILITRFYSNRRAKKFFGSLSYSLHKQYAALFTFPRKVMLMAVKSPDGAELFPIDLHGIPSSGKFLFALRHSNRAISLLQQKAPVCVASVDVRDYQKVYALGKFNREAPVNNSAPDVLSKTWGIALPGFVLDYYDLEVVDDDDVGSQRLFRSNIIHREVITEGLPLHHVHILEYIQDFMSVTSPAPY